MFGLKKKSLYAPCTGKVIPLQNVPDEAFAGGMLGEGFGIEPEEGRILSPVNGEVRDVTETGHAYTILSEDGIELLVHVGIDTVSMKGEGFCPRVKVGERVRVGAPLVEADLSLIKARGLSTVTVVLIPEADRLKNTEYYYKNAVGGKDVVMQFDWKKG